MKTTTIIVSSVLLASIVGVTATYALNLPVRSMTESFISRITSDSGFQQRKNHVHQSGQTSMKQTKANGGVNSQSTKHNPGELTASLPYQELSQEEKDMLTYSYSEELLAHDMYQYFYSLYGVQSFTNIAASESEHQTAVKALLDKYALPTPITYGELADEFAALKAEGSKGLKEALEVGVKIEMLDIDDIAKSLQITDNDDIKVMYANIGGASFNHLRGFVQGLRNNNLTTELDYSKYLTEEETFTKGGGLKQKMAEKVIALGVTMPKEAQPDFIAANCKEEEGKEGHGASSENTQDQAVKQEQGQSKGMGQSKGQGQGKGMGQGQGGRQGQGNGNGQNMKN